MRQVAEHYLNNIERDKKHNNFVEVFRDEILDRADLLQSKINQSPDTLGSLFGAVVSIKDNLCYEGHKVSAASKMLEDYVSPYSATVVDRLISADALIIGRTNCDEFSMGSTSESSFHGDTLNSIDPDRVPGGSSGGAAVACSLDHCLVSVGSDTGGSIRQPAAFNGLIGYKPSYGMISRWGLIAYASSLDCVGLIGKNPEDLISVMHVVSGPDDFDSTAIQKQGMFDTDMAVGDKLRLACFDNFLSSEQLNEEMWREWQRFRARKLGHLELSEIQFENEDFLVPCYYILCMAEAASNLARYDGIRYGHSEGTDFEDFRDMVKASRTAGFGSEVKKRIMLGNYVLSEGYYDAFFQKALDVRAYFKNTMNALLEEYDYIIMPVTAGGPWKFVDELDPIEVYNADKFTVLANLTGLPSVTIPMSNKTAESPLGIQILSKYGNDQSLLAFADTLAKV